MIRFILAFALALTPAAALGGDLPFYCKALTKFERSCTGVKAAALALGKSRAQWLAQHCGANEYDLQQARDCLSSEADKRYGCKVSEQTTAGECP